jgi:hypothetical protein
MRKRMMQTLASKACLLLAATLFVGCNSKVKEEQIEIKPQVSPVEPIKSVLKRYANGEPMGSEATSFDGLVAELRKTDATKADIAAQAFADIQKTPAKRAAIAKETLKKLE